MHTLCLKRVQHMATAVLTAIVIMGLVGETALRSGNHRHRLVKFFSLPRSLLKHAHTRVLRHCCGRISCAFLRVWVRAIDSCVILAPKLVSECRDDVDQCVRAESDELVCNACALSLAHFPQHSLFALAAFAYTQACLWSSLHIAHRRSTGG